MNFNEKNKPYSIRMFFTYENLYIEFLQCVSILEEEGHRQHRFQPSAQVKDITVQCSMECHSGQN
jgi:hypothetical protein